MVITIKGRENIIINNIDEFYNFVNSIILNINISYINKDVTDYYNSSKDIIIGLKKIKSQIKLLFFNKTILNSEYWISRGWSNEYALDKIKDIQSKRSKIGIDKMNTLKLEDNFKWKSLKNTNIEYYIDKGYSKEEAIVLRKNRQKTFSKDICIDKHGEELGLEIWNNRQNKWIESLNNYVSINGKLNSDSNSLSHYKIKHPDNYLIESIKRSYFCNKELILNAIESTNSISEFCIFISKNKNIYSVSELSSIYNSKLLTEYHRVDSKTFKTLLIKEFGIIPSKFGNIRYFNNHICRSNGEFYIATKLKELGIEYKYEKKYPNSNYICDFYLIKEDVYVEYMGFLKSSYMNKEYKDVCDKYLEKYIEKEKMCNSLKLNFIYESDYKLIINKIINYGRNVK